MNWKMRLAQWLMRHEQETKEANLVIGGSHRGRILDHDRHAVNFTIHKASGGYVVESTFYDEKRDQHNRSLHIITNQEDFSEELGKAVFMEMLKHH